MIKPRWDDAKVALAELQYRITIGTERTERGVKAIYTVTGVGVHNNGTVREYRTLSGAVRGTIGAEAFERWLIADRRRVARIDP